MAINCYTLIQSLVASGGVWRAYSMRPYISWYTDILRIKMYPGRGVSHTPSERFQRKRRDTPRHKNDHSPPPATFGSVCDTPLQSWYTDIPEISSYPSRGVSHTPSERFRRKQRDTSIHKNDLSPPPAAFVGRMQYAPTVIQELNPKKWERKIRIHD